MTSVEEPSISWTFNNETGPYWTNPGLNFSIDIDSSINITAPVFFCEFNERFVEGFWARKWDIRQQTVLDLVGHILVITREEEVWAYA